MVKTFPDGQCFFRCIASQNLRCLRNAQRSQGGRILDQSLQNLEQSYADAIRQHVLEFLHTQVDKLNDLASMLPLFLDRRISECFSSIEKRLEAMSKSSEYAGLLEMLAFCYIAQRSISVYQSHKSGSGTPTLIAKLPMFSAVFDSEKPYMLLHEFDTLMTEGHFDLLVADAEGHDDITPDQFKIKVQQSCLTSFLDFLQFPQDQANTDTTDKRSYNSVTFGSELQQNADSQG